MIAIRQSAEQVLAALGKAQRRVIEHSPVWSSLASIGLLLFVFLVVDKALMQACRLPAHKFHEPVLLLAYFKSLPSFPKSLLVFTIGGLLLLLHHRAALGSWKNVQHGHSIRIVVVAAGFTLAWPFATADFNLYFNQQHLLDRIAVIGFCVLLWWRPIFVIPLLISVLPLIAIRDVPLGLYTWTTHLMPLKILILFAAMFAMGAVVRRWQVASFFFLLLCIVASHYATPGMEKVKSNWFSLEHVQLLVPVRYATGWRGLLDPQNIGQFTNAMRPLDMPIKVLVLILECGGLFILAGKRLTAIPLLIGWVCFHICIFLLSGICFWQWVVINFTLAVVLWKLPDYSRIPIFTKTHVALSIALIATNGFWLRAPPLFWIDTPLIYTYRLEGQGESGKSYNLPSSFFGPYGFELKLWGFAFLERNRPLLGRVWGGVMDPDEARAAASVKSLEAALAFEREFGRIQYQPERAARAEEFLQRFFVNFNARESKDSVLSVIKAPPLLWLSKNSDDYTGQEPIRSVGVYQVFSLWDGYRLRIFRELQLREVEIPKQRRKIARG